MEAGSRVTHLHSFSAVRGTCRRGTSANTLSTSRAGIVLFFGSQMLTPSAPGAAQPRSQKRSPHDAAGRRMRPPGRVDCKPIHGADGVDRSSGRMSQLKIAPRLVELTTGRSRSREARGAVSRASPARTDRRIGRRGRPSSLPQKSEGFRWSRPDVVWRAVDVCARHGQIGRRYRPRSESRRAKSSGRRRLRRRCAGRSRTGCARYRSHEDR